MIFRALRRAVALGFVLAYCVLQFWLIRLRGPLTLAQRAKWMSDSCKRTLKSFGIRYTVEGTPPTYGLIVGNHLSYLDILIYSAAAPAFFISKVEIGSWPFFGPTARMSGTIFLDRASQRSASAVAALMVERFNAGAPIMLFPEGTSTDGSRVLPFHPRLIDPATSNGIPITAASVRYIIDSGQPERELCWFDDQLFLPHLWRTLGADGFRAQLRYGRPTIYTDRRVAADTTHAEITAMRAQRIPD
jgi:1-acyl-sn-glycerol-3-phosphate acyltransferase